MSAPRVDLILRQLDALPALPAVAAKVLDATGRDDADARRVTVLIESDPALTAHLLRVARRAGVAAREVTSVARAVVLLGLAEVRAAVLAQGVLKALPAAGDVGDGVRRADFWTHSLAVACASELLAARVARRGVYLRRETDPAEAFTCGLLHDLGKLALHAVLPKSYARIVAAAETARGDISDLERQVVGVDHATAGRRLAEKWALPPVVRDAIWLHNQHPDALPEQAARHAPLVNVVTLADSLVRRLHIGYSGNYAPGVATAVLLERLGLGAADLADVGGQLVDAMTPRAAMLGLSDADAAALHHNALNRAGEAALAAGAGRQNAAAKAALPKVSQGDAFVALGTLRHELHPGTGVREVLEAIARSAVDALGVASVAAVSLPPERAGADVLVADANGVRAVVSAAGDDPDDRFRARKPAVSNGPRVAGGDLAWLVRLVAAHLPGDAHAWLCLEADGECVGGVLMAGGNPAGDFGAVAAGWSLALRLAQSREAAADVADQLAQVNRRLGDAQERIARDRALVAVAELAAGAAHEMNNPLMVISGRSQLLFHALTNPRDKQAALTIHSNAGRLSEMISELMRFAKPSAAAVTDAPVSTLIAESLALVERLPERAGRRIELDVADLPPVRVDVNQVARAVSNLLENALQATAQDHGEVEVRAALDLTATNLLLTVADAGPGMDEATLRHAGEPFFSKKDAGRRRGMGLALATRLIESNGGSLRLESTPGHGTRAVVRLPLARPQAVALRRSA